MIKKKSISLSRTSPKSENYDLVLIVCEGSDTEVHYFNNLIVVEKLSTVNITVSGESGSAPISVVDHAIKLYEERMKENNLDTRFDKVFCVFDRDEHTSFNQAINKALNYQYKVNDGEIIKDIITPIRSFPCFEYWYLCHFSNTRASITKTGSKSSAEKCIEILDPFWLKKFGQKYQKNQKLIYQNLFNELSKAITNSKSSLRDSINTQENNPSTEIHILIEYLKKLKS